MEASVDMEVQSNCVLQVEQSPRASGSFHMMAELMHTHDLLPVRR